VKKLIVLFCVVLLVFPLVMTGCGVAKSEYEAVVAERNTLQAEKDALETERDELQAELDATKSDVTSLVAELDKKLIAVAVIDGYFSDSLRYFAGEMSESDLTGAMTAFMSDFGGVLDDVGNDELSQLWDDAVAATELGDGEEFSSNIAAIIASLTDLIDDDIAAIEARLS